MGLDNGIPCNISPYPRYLYKDDEEPRLVNNQDEDDAARQAGFDSITAGALSNRHMINWFWDLEDMSPRQLRVFALDEYDVDLPNKATQEMLFKSVCLLSRAAPQNRNRLVLMAHTIKMNYDAALQTIRDAIKHPPDGYEVKIESYEVTL